MNFKASLQAPRRSRRPSRLGDLLAAQKLNSARSLTPEQRLLLALELSDAAFHLYDACLKKP